VYRLVDSEFYHGLLFKEHHAPAMQRAPLDKLILDTKLLDFGSPKELLALAMDPPHLSNIAKLV
jgi:ATP-dependent RNA helicase TDRD9